MEFIIHGAIDPVSTAREIKRTLAAECPTCLGEGVVLHPDDEPCPEDGCFSTCPTCDGTGDRAVPPKREGI